jgi:polyphosphate kinase
VIKFAAAPTETVTIHQATGARPNGVCAASVGSPETYISRELSWLAFASRVVAMVEDERIPLLERVWFAGIMGMLHDEFYMKRIGKLRRAIREGSRGLTLDGRLPEDELVACDVVVREQTRRLAAAIEDDLRPALAAAGVPILDHDQLTRRQQGQLRRYFERSVEPILTPLAVDAEHPFPFISSLGLNIGVLLPDADGDERFVRIKVPGNRPRWLAVPSGAGVVPLEQVIAANLDLMFPTTPPAAAYFFRVTRAAEGQANEGAEELTEPGSIVQLVSSKLKARRFARAVRLQVDPAMPEALVEWLGAQLDLEPIDIDRSMGLLRVSDLMGLSVARPDLRYPPHEPVTHPRLRRLRPEAPGDIFEEIARGDILLHHPYHSFDTSVLRFLQSAAVDGQVLAIKTTLYRTNSDSPIIQALAEAARRGKQVAVLVEITARFDEAPNIAWGELLENEGVHVAYGVERLKTHVKLALVVREERGQIRRYAHVGTGNYHTGTARQYEDLGLLTCDGDICADAAAVFNALTGSTHREDYRKMLVAPVTMRRRFVEMIRREADHARAGRPSGIKGKLNQLEDAEIIAELYHAGQAGVPICLHVRGMCCLRAGVPGLSDNIRVVSVIGRFLEHGRIYRFENGGDPEYYIGSADWMTRNLTKRVETIAPVEDRKVRAQLDEILAVYDADNATAWDAQPDGTYVRRQPATGEPWRGAQERFIDLARRS